MRQVKAYLTELVSRADGGGELPEIITMRRDVSQGSVICPLLLLSFVNDLPGALKALKLLFTDEVK